MPIVKLSEDASKKIISLVQEMRSENIEKTVRLCLNKNNEINVSEICSGSTTSCSLKTYCSDDSVGIGVFHTHPVLGSYKLSISGKPHTSNHSKPDLKQILFRDKSKKLILDDYGIPVMQLIDCVGNAAAYQIECLVKKESLPDDFSDLYVGLEKDTMYRLQKLETNLLDGIFYEQLNMMKDLVESEDDKRFIESVIRDKKGWLDMNYDEKKRLYYIRGLVKSKRYKDKEESNIAFRRLVNRRDSLAATINYMSLFSNPYNPEVFDKLFELKSFFVPKDAITTKEVKCNAVRCYVADTEGNVRNLGSNKITLVQMLENKNTITKLKQGDSFAFDSEKDCIFNKNKNVLLCGAFAKPEDFTFEIPEHYFKHTNDFLNLKEVAVKKLREVMRR